MAEQLSVARAQVFAADIVTSTMFRQVMRAAAREIVRGAFKTGRR